MKYIIVSRRRGFPNAFFYEGNWYYHIYTTFATKEEAYEKMHELAQTTVIPGQFLSVTEEENYYKIWKAA